MSALTLSPSTAFATPNGRRNFSASGGTPPYVFSVSGNRSGGSIDPATGLYLAGPRGLVPDIVTVTDATPSTASAVVTVSAGLYQNFQRGLGPPSLQLPTGRLIEGNFGAEKDVVFERARQGLLVGIPGLGPPDALDLIGQERQLPRAVGEGDADYAVRLSVVWDDVHGWTPAGSFQSMLYALDRAGFPMGDPDGAHVVQRYRRYLWLSASGGSPVEGSHHPVWTFDGAPLSNPNQFGIVFGADVPGLSTGTALANQLNATVNLWRPLKAKFMGTWIVLSGSIWGWTPAAAIWGAGGRTWGGSSRFVSPM